MGQKITPTLDNSSLKVVATDTNDFAQLHRKFLASLPGVAQIQSSFSLKNVFKETGLPV